MTIVVGYVPTPEGNGPDHSLDRALRDALETVHPHLKDIELVNFKVRILDESHGTDAVTRVVVDRYGAIGWTYLTGRWPGERAPKPEE